MVVRLESQHWKRGTRDIWKESGLVGKKEKEMVK